MKKLMILFVAVLLAACGAQKKMNIGANDDYVDTKDYFYSSFYGTAKDPNAAKHIAKLNCRADLATKINGRIQAAVETYYNQYVDEGLKKGMARDEGGKTEFNFMSTVEANIGNIIEEVKGRMLAPNKKGEYTYFVAMRVKRSDCEKVMNDIQSTLPDEIKQRIDNDQERFRERLREELNK